jgi:quinohemoprotein ethanol dehydrogenase
MTTTRPGLIVTSAALLLCAPAFGQSARVDMKRLLNADKEAGQWMSHSRTFDEQ